MRKERLSQALCLVFLAAILVAGVAFNASKPRVMILHSYDPEYAWSRDIDVGLHRVVDKWHDCSVSWHYMDTKKHPDPQWLRRAGIIARRAVARNSPHVLIAVDDLAQELAARHFVDDPRMDIVFAGVNAGIEPYGYHRAGNVTGILEHKVLKAVQETILAIRSRGRPPLEAPRMLYILDTSESLLSDRRLVDAFDWSPVDYRGSHVAGSFEHWKEIVRTHGPSVDYILVANYRKLPRSDGDPTLADPGEVMAWTDRHSPAPVIGINAFNVEDGAMLAVGPSPFEQGEVAATLARRIIDEGIRGGRIPVQENRQYIVAMRQEAMSRRGLRLPMIYEAYAYFLSLTPQGD